MIKNILKKIIKFYVNKENRSIKKIINENFNSNFKMLDIGAAGDINKRWSIIKDKISIFLVEPHPESANELKQKGVKVIERFLYEEEGKNIKFYQTKKKTNSGFLKPNLVHLKKFPDLERYNIEETVDVSTSTLDNEIKKMNVKNLDFVKIDTEGSELNILKGSKNTLKNVLGLEIECNLFHLREDSPLFEDIRNYLKNYGIIFVDFLNIIRWEMNNYKSLIGQPQFADVLFLKDPSIVLSNFKNNLINENTLLNYLIVLTIYYRSDMLDFMVNNLEKNFVEERNLDKLNNLVKKKNKRLNNIFKISDHFRNSLLGKH